MRVRVGLLIISLFAATFTGLPQSAIAFSGFASAPLAITATPIAGGVRVAWTPPTDVDTGVLNYRIETSTSGADNTWGLVTTVSSATRSYDITGLSQSAVYTRVAATTSAGIGTYGYPWTKVYGTTSLNRNSDGTVTYESNYGLGASDPYTTLTSATFSRIRYRLDTTISGVAKYAEADAYKWVTGDSTKSVYGTAPSVSSLMIPTVNAGYEYVIQANVTDLNVYSDSGNVTKGKGLSGRLEIWPWNYDKAVSGLTGAGSGVTYDYDDTSNGNGSYGSFQVHDMTNLQPVFVWNNSGNGATAEVNYGKNATSGGNPDWTFCAGTLAANGACPSPSAFKLQIFINMPVTPLAENIPPVITRIDAKSIIKNGDTISVQSNELGTVYLIRNSVAVSNSASLSGAAANVKNSVAITSANTTTTLSTSGLLDGTYSLYAVDAVGNVSTAISNTLTMDSTPPTVTSIYLNTSGLTVFMNMSETVTHTSMGDTLYTISDGGPTNNVGSTGGSATQLQISVYRAIPAGATVNFAYTPSAGAASGRWVDLAGNELAAIALAPITNNSTVGVSVSLTAPTTMYKGVAVNISTSVNYPGKVTFLDQGKRIAGCIGKAASGTPPITVTCSYKARARGSTSLSAIYTPSNSSIAGGVTPIQNRFILNRSNTR
jgi:hypothetical protein